MEMAEARERRQCLKPDGDRRLADTMKEYTYGYEDQRYHLSSRPDIHHLPGPLRTFARENGLLLNAGQKDTGQ